MVRDALRRAFVPASMALCLLAGCGRHTHELQGGWAQVGDAAIFHGGGETEDGTCHGGFVLARLPDRPMQVVYAWIGRLEKTEVSGSSGRGFDLHFGDGVGTFEEHASCRDESHRFTGSVAWNAAKKQLEESLEWNGVRIDLGSGRAFAVDWRGEMRSTQLVVDLPAPTEEEVKGAEKDVVLRLAKKYLELLRADPKVTAFLDAK